MALFGKSAVFQAVYTFVDDNWPLLLALFLIVAWVGLIILLLNGDQPARNPIHRRTVRPPSPVVTDQSTRDKVLKLGFKPDRVPDRLDAIVIGSGIGGLTAGSLLARAGRRVLVLEQHDQAGGCCHVFQEKGYEFDVGIHYIGEMRHATMQKSLIECLTDGQLQWEDLDDNYDTLTLGKGDTMRKYPVIAGKEAFRENLLKQFPEEQKAIDKWISMLSGARRAYVGGMILKATPRWAARVLVATGIVNLFTDYFTYARMNLRTAMTELTENEDLRAVICYCFGDYGTLPSDSSFVFHASLINHFRYGVSYPRGGASEIAFHMIPGIERAGGKVLVRAPVKEILVRRGKAIGVKVQKSSGDINIFAPLIISDAGVFNTLQNLLPREIAAKSYMHPLIEKGKIKHGHGAMSLFVGLKGGTKELGLSKVNIWAYLESDFGPGVAAYLKGTPEEAMDNDIPLLFISFPSAKDPTWQERNPDKSMCTVVTLANYDWFARWKDERVMKRGVDYDAVKNAIGQRMWDQTLAQFPQLEDKVEYFSVGSPVTNDYYIGAARGEIYGMDHNITRFSDPDVVVNMRPETGVPGLLLTGQDICSCGFAGGMWGGVMCASAALHRNLMNDLQRLKKDTSNNEAAAKVATNVTTKVTPNSVPNGVVDVAGDDTKKKQ